MTKRINHQYVPDKQGIHDLLISNFETKAWNP